MTSPKLLHVVSRPYGLDFSPCKHKPTLQEYAVLPCGGTVETQHGTMAFRTGDYLVVGTNGALYCLSPESFGAAYDVLER